MATRGDNIFLTKGVRPDVEEYSIFDNDESATQLRHLVAAKAIAEIDICGVAREYCVKESLLGADGAWALAQLCCNLLEIVALDVHVVHARQVAHASRDGHVAFVLYGACLSAIVFLTLLAITWRQKRKLSSAYHSLFNKTQESIQHDKVITRQLDAMDKSDRKKDSNVPPVAPPKKEPDETEREVRLKPEAPVVMHDKVRTMPNAEQQNELLAAILQVMENTDAYCDPEFGIEKLATMTNSNSRYVSQVINEVYGMNFRALVNDFRIKKAMIRMSDTENYGNLTIRAIAESVGYKSQANFINVFTKITGLKPSTYLKLLKEKQLDKAS